MCLFKNLFFTTQATLTPAKNEIRETESDIAIVVVFVLMLFSLLSLSSLTSGCRTSFLETSNFTIGEKFQNLWLNFFNFVLLSAKVICLVDGIGPMHTFSITQVGRTPSKS